MVNSGLTSLKDKAVNMNRGPRGLEPYVQYMEPGGAVGSEPMEPSQQPTIKELEERIYNLKAADSVANRFSPQTPFSKYSSPEDPNFIPNKQVNPELFNEYQGYKSGVEFGDIETGMDLLSATKFDPLLQAGLRDMRSLSDYAQVIKPERQGPIDKIKSIQGQFDPTTNNLNVMSGSLSGETLAHELMHKGADYLERNNPALKKLIEQGGEAEHRYIQSVSNMSFMNKMMNEEAAYLNRLYKGTDSKERKVNIGAAVIAENNKTLLKEVGRVMDFYYSDANRLTLYSELEKRLGVTPSMLDKMMKADYGELSVNSSIVKEIFTIANEVMANDFATSELGQKFKEEFDKSDRQEGFFDMRQFEQPQQQPAGQEPPRGMAEGGVISLKDTAVRMFEDGGEPKYEQGQDLGDVEMRSDLEPYLYGNPLARLGYELYKEGTIKISGAPVDEALDSFGLYSDKKKEIAYVANQREDAPNPLRILTHELSHAAIAYLEGKDKANKAGFNKYGNVDYEEGVVRGGDVLIDRRAPTKGKLAQDFFGNIQPTKAGLKQFMRVSRSAQEDLNNRGIAPEAISERETGFYGTSGQRIPTAMENFKNLFGMDVDPNVNNYLNLTGYTVNYAEGGVISLKDTAVRMFENGGEAQIEETMPPQLQGAYEELSQELIQDPRTGDFRYRTDEEIIKILNQFQSQDFLQDVASGGFEIRPSVQGGGSVTNKKSFIGTLDGEPMYKDIRVNQGGGRLGFDAVAPNKDKFGAGVSVYGSKGRAKAPEVLQQFGVDRVQKFGSNKVNVGGLDAYYRMMNALNEGDSVTAGVNYNPNSEEKNYNVNYNAPVKDLGIPALTQGAVNMYRRMIR